MENLVLAFLFGCGVFLMFAAFGFRKTLFRRIIDRADREGPEVVTVAEERILRALLADWSRRIRPERATLEESLRRSGWVYASTAEYHFRRMVDAILSALAGLLVGLVFHLYFGFSLPGMAILASLLAVAGFLSPDYTIRAALARRGELLLREMGFGLERIALFLQSGAELSDALAQCQGLGLFGRAAAKLSMALKTHQPISEAVLEMKQHLPVSPPFEEFLELIRASQTRGQNLVEPFQVAARQMRQRLQLDLIRAGNQAKTRIVLITSGVILVASLIVILAPMLLLLQSSGVF
ncbi:MAG: type II secretion system F family protein [Anaerolineae bacterium]|nr:type II secretion system F family protein [Anaerolineae bacterium]